MIKMRGVLVLVLVMACVVFGRNLVPDKAANTGDYFCTWGVQGYVCSYETREKQREAITEANLFGGGEYQGWVNFHEALRGDLFFVLDDSWYVSESQASGYGGSMISNEEKFPSYSGEHIERLSKLVRDIEVKGWKGVGLWISSQETLQFEDQDIQEYWGERLEWMKEAGVDYWKVDLGSSGKSYDWRERLSDLGKNRAEELLMSSVMNYSEIFLTDEVDNVIATPQTLERIGEMLIFEPMEDTKCIINCGDEPYIGAALGCSIGIMRYPFKKDLPDGKQDLAYPPVGRDIKNRADEIVRAVRWHRIAGPFEVGTTKDIVDSTKLIDTWYLKANETLNDPDGGGTLRQEAPARISRGLELAEVKVWGYDPAPYVLTSRHPNGAIAVATLGRTKDREYVLERAKVKVKVGRDFGPIGIFGRYETLIIDFLDKMDNAKVWGQDLAGDTAVDITEKVKIEGSRLIVPGDVIDEIGLANATTGDKSDPGMVIVIEKP